MSSCSGCRRSRSQTCPGRCSCSPPSAVGPATTAGPEDGPPDAEVVIPEFLERAWRRQAAVLQFLGVIAADHARRDLRQATAVCEAVAALSRKNVERRAATASPIPPEAVRTISPGRCSRRRRRPTPGAVEGRADADAIDLQPAFVGPAAGVPKTTWRRRRVSRRAARRHHVRHQAHQPLRTNAPPESG